MEAHIGGTQYIQNHHHDQGRQHPKVIANANLISSYNAVAARGHILSKFPYFFILLHNHASCSHMISLTGMCNKIRKEKKLKVEEVFRFEVVNLPRRNTAIISQIRRPRDTPLVEHRSYSQRLEGARGDVYSGAQTIQPTSSVESTLGVRVELTLLIILFFFLLLLNGGLGDTVQVTLTYCTC